MSSRDFVKSSRLIGFDLVLKSDESVHAKVNQTIMQYPIVWFTDASWDFIV